MCAGAERKRLTDYSKELEVQVPCEDARRQFAQEALEKASDGMRVPILVARKQINISLYSFESATLNKQRGVTHHC